MVHAINKNNIIYAGVWRGYKVLFCVGVVFISFSLLVIWMNDFYKAGINSSLYPAIFFAIPGLIMLFSFKGIVIDYDNLVVTKNLFCKKKEYLPIKNFKYILFGEKSLYEAKPVVLAHEPTEVLAVFLIDIHGEKFDISDFFPMTLSPRRNFLIAKMISESINKPIVIGSNFKRE